MDIVHAATAIVAYMCIAKLLALIIAIDGSASEDRPAIILAVAELFRRRRRPPRS